MPPSYTTSRRYAGPTNEDPRSAYRELSPNPTRRTQAPKARNEKMPAGAETRRYRPASARTKHSPDPTRRKRRRDRAVLFHRSARSARSYAESEGASRGLGAIRSLCLVQSDNIQGRRTAIHRRDCKIKHFDRPGVTGASWNYTSLNSSPRGDCRDGRRFTQSVRAKNGGWFPMGSNPLCGERDLNARGFESHGARSIPSTGVGGVGVRFGVSRINWLEPQATRVGDQPSTIDPLASGG